MHNPIVIIGGMGPQASVRFHQLLLEKSGRYHGGDGDAYPFIAHFSLAVKDFISDDGARTAAIETLRAYTPAIRALQPSQVTLACNTAHILAPQADILRQKPFVSLIETVAEHVQAQGITTAGLLATPTTIRTKLYENAFTAKGISTITPGKREQELLETAIRAVIAGAPLAQHQGALLKIARDMQHKGAEAIVLGCTELPLVFPAAKAALPVYDCLDLYAEAVIARHYLYNGA
jgi:aspartate racemase